LDPSAHVARRLTPAMVADADLVLTADSSHRSIVVQSEPLVFRRAFTMREFARLGTDLGHLELPATSAALRDRVAVVADQRGWVEPAELGADDIGDPFGAGLEVARSTAQALAAAVDGVIAALGIRAVANLAQISDAAPGPGRS
jgi:protein-tyrosine-phosphatase